MSDLNSCWNGIYRRLLNFRKHDYVSFQICGLGRLDFHHVPMRLLKKCSRSRTTMRGTRTAASYFCNSFVRTSSITIIFFTHILQYIFYHLFIPYSLYGQRRGTSLRFKTTAVQCTVHCCDMPDFIYSDQPVTSYNIPVFSIQGGPKMAQFFYALASSNVNRLSKLFHC